MENMACPGFKAAGIAAGIKKNGEKDLGIIYSEVPANAAAVFTRNRVQAAPVLLDRQRIASGICRAVIANSGNANCCTGDQGMRDALAMAESVASEVGIDPDEVFVASTGVIGELLPIDIVLDAVPRLVGSCGPGNAGDFARSIMTTDTVPKVVTRQGSLNGKSYRITGVAKGSGMIRPDMATMLCFVFTDAAIPADSLGKMLAEANECSFNRITIDGDTSTNDTVLLMANGLSGARVANGEDQQAAQKTLNGVLSDLARMIVRDGEGATKLVDITVEHADSDQDARIVADTVAHSNLVKTALFGEDANWGRILAAVGRAGVPMKPDRVDIYFGDVLMVEKGVGCGKGAEAEATKVLRTREFSITIDLNMGTGTASVLTCDLSLDYVRINADYRT